MACASLSRKGLQQLAGDKRRAIAGKPSKENPYPGGITAGAIAAIPSRSLYGIRLTGAVKSTSLANKN